MQSPRQILAALVVVGAAFIAAGCSSPDTDDDASNSVAPVTVTTSAGSVTIDTVPKG